MVRVSENFLQQITLLAKDGYVTCDASGARVIDAADPIDAQDLVTKSYIDGYLVGMSWSASLANGNTTDGYNPTISIGDVITSEDELNITSASKKSIIIQPGAGVTGDGGSLYLLGGDAAPGGLVKIAAGDPVSGRGSVVMIFGSDAATGADADGGYIDIAAGSGDGTGNGGDLYLYAGDGGTTGGGGIVEIYAGSGGGDITLTAGDTGSGEAGGITLTGGTSTDTLGGDITIIAGAGFNSEGGDISITSGTSTNSSAGDIEISGGDAPAGEGGTVSISAGSSGTFVSGSNVSINGGDVTTVGGTAGGVSITGGSATGAALTGGSVTITGGSGPTHNGGNVSVAGGGAGSGSTPGNTTISAGTSADQATGNVLVGTPTVGPFGVSTSGYTSITTGNAITAGDINIQPGAPVFGGGFPGTAGVVNITGGDGSSGGATPGGDINITSGDGGTGTWGGDVTIGTGTGDGYDGYIIFQRGSVEAARFDGNGFLDVNANRIVDVQDPVDAQDAATKNYVDGYFETNNEWSEVLVNGNTSGGTNPIISYGDKLQVAKTGGGTVDVLTIDGSDDLYFGANVATSMYFDVGNSQSYHFDINTAESFAISQTALTIGVPALEFTAGVLGSIGQSNSLVGDGTDLTIRAQAGLTGGSNTGGDLILAGGWGSNVNGDGGDVNVRGGRYRGSGAIGGINFQMYYNTGSTDFDTMAFFTRNITPTPDRIQLSIGNATQGYDGEILAPDGSSAAGHDLFISTGGGDTDQDGGDLVLSGGLGDGAGADGYVIINQGTTEVARWDSSGNLDVATNRVVDMSDPVDAQDAVTKAYVDSLVVTPVQETLTVSILGQTVFTLSSTPAVDNAVRLWVEGTKQQYGVDYTVSGTTLTWSGSQTLQTTDVVEAVYNTGGLVVSTGTTVISPTPIDGYTTDWSPTGWSTANVVRIDATDGYDITGFDYNATVIIKKIINVSSSDIVLLHEDGSSTAANRILIPSGSDLTLEPDDAVDIFYDVVDARWRLT